MKKLDKLIFKSFIGPFFLTFCVVVFIFLLQFLLRHFDDIVGKGLSWDIYARLLGYFSINMTPVSFPLAILLSSLMTYGNLGEHSEITALKGAGISLTRTLVPMFVFSLLVTALAFISNNYLVPRANLKAYSLLYDIKQKAPALNIKEGVFYKDIPGYQIKVNKKFKDGETLKDIIIYDHTKGSGNRSVILADSGKMYTIMSDRYLVMELFDGHHYSEEEAETNRKRGSYSQTYPEPYARNSFERSKVVLSMAAFDLKRTKEELFAGHFLMKSMNELKYDIDSLTGDIKFAKYEAFANLKAKFDYHLDNLTVPPALEPENYGRQKQKDTTNIELAGNRAAQRGDRNMTAFSKSVQDQVRDTVQVQKNTGEQEQDLVEEQDRKEQDRKEEDGKGQVREDQVRDTGQVQKNAGEQEREQDQDQDQEQEELVAGAAESNKDTSSNNGLENNTARQPLKTKKEERLDSRLKNVETIERVVTRNQPVVQGTFSMKEAGADSILNGNFNNKRILTSAVTNARFVKNHIMVTSSKVDVRERVMVRHAVQRYKIFAQAFSCLIMFLIGAPLGSIIKRGGLGFPVIVSIGFFIVYYVLMNMGDKWAREDLMTPFMGVWLANFILLPVGAFLLRQARIDARLFDTDFYNVMIEKIRAHLRTRLKNQKFFILFNR